MRAWVRRFPRMPLLQPSLSCASSLFNPKSFKSLPTHSDHVFLPLPLPLTPSTSRYVHFDTQSSSSLRSTCQNHLSLPLFTISPTSSIPRLCLSSSVDFLFFIVIPHIHLTIILSACCNLCRSSK